jgi:deoxyribonuclease-4
MSRRPIGLHVSIAGRLSDAVERAKQLGCVETFQIFTCSPRRWEAAPLKDEEADAFRDAARSSGYTKVFCHMPYLPNLCSPESKFYTQSVDVLVR